MQKKQLTDEELAQVVGGQMQKMMSKYHCTECGKDFEFDMNACKIKCSYCRKEYLLEG